MHYLFFGYIFTSSNKQTITNMKAKIKYNGKIIEIPTISNPFNTWVLYKGKLYRNLNSIK